MGSVVCVCVNWDNDSVMVVVSVLDLVVWRYVFPLFGGEVVEGFRDACQFTLLHVTFWRRVMRVALA